MITGNPQENLEGITQKTEIDIGEDPILEIDPIIEVGMMRTDIEGDLKIDMIGLIQEKGLIDINHNTDLTLETGIEEMMTDIEEMTDIEMMTDIEEMTAIEMMTDIEEMTDIEMMTDIEEMTDTEMMTDIEGMTDIEMMTDTEGMTGIEMIIDTGEVINLTKKARYGVISVNQWAIIH